MRKPLLAAGEICDKGNYIVLDSLGGYVVAKGSLQTQIRALVDKAVKNYSKDLVPVRKENGVYNLYMQIDEVDKGAEQISNKDLCAAAAAAAGADDDDMEDEGPLGVPGGGETLKAGQRREGGRLTCR